MSQWFPANMPGATPSNGQRRGLVVALCGLSARRTRTRLGNGLRRLLATQETTAILLKPGPLTGRELQSASTSFCLATFKRRKRRAPAHIVLDGHNICLLPSTKTLHEFRGIQPNPTKSNHSKAVEGGARLCRRPAAATPAIQRDLAHLPALCLATLLRLTEPRSGCSNHRPQPVHCLVNSGESNLIGPNTGNSSTPNPGPNSCQFVKFVSHSYLRAGRTRRDEKPGETRTSRIDTNEPPSPEREPRNTRNTRTWDDDRAACTVSRDLTPRTSLCSLRCCSKSVSICVHLWSKNWVSPLGESGGIQPNPT
jgi:hypothetical protein